jgi:hypothetical protein
MEWRAKPLRKERWISSLTASIASFVLFSAILTLLTPGFPLFYVCFIATIPGLLTYLLVDYTFEASVATRTSVQLHSGAIHRLLKRRVTLILMLVVISTSTFLPISSDVKYGLFFVAVFFIGSAARLAIGSWVSAWEFIISAFLIGYSIVIGVSLLATELGQAGLMEPFYFGLVIVVFAFAWLRLSSSLTLELPGLKELSILTGVTIPALTFPLLSGSGLYVLGYDYQTFESNATALLHGGMSQIPIAELGLSAFLAFGYQFSGAPLHPVRVILDASIWIFPAAGVAFMIGQFRNKLTTIITLLIWGTFSSLSWTYWIYSTSGPGGPSNWIGQTNQATDRMVEDIGAGLNLVQVRPDAISLAYLSFMVGILILAYRGTVFGREMRGMIILFTAAAYLSHPPEVLIAVFFTGVAAGYQRRSAGIAISVLLGLSAAAIVLYTIRPIFTLPLVVALFGAATVPVAWLVGSGIKKVLTKAEWKRSRDLAKSILSRTLWIAVIISPIVWIYELSGTNFSASQIDPYFVVGWVPWFMYLIVGGIRVPLSMFGFPNLKSDEKTLTGLALVSTFAVLLGLTWINANLFSTGFGALRILLGPMMIVLSIPMAGFVESLSNIHFNVAWTKVLAIALLVVVVVSGTLSIGISVAARYYEGSYLSKITSSEINAPLVSSNLSYLYSTSSDEFIRAQWLISPVNAFDSFAAEEVRTSDDPSSLFNAISSDRQPGNLYMSFDNGSQSFYVRNHLMDMCNLMNYSSFTICGFDTTPPPPNSSSSFGIVLPIWSMTNPEKGNIYTGYDIVWASDRPFQSIFEPFLNSTSAKLILVPFDPQNQSLGATSTTSQDLMNLYNIANRSLIVLTSNWWLANDSLENVGLREFNTFSVGNTTFNLSQSLTTTSYIPSANFPWEVVAKYGNYPVAIRRTDGSKSLTLILAGPLQLALQEKVLSQSNYFELLRGIISQPMQQLESQNNRFPTVPANPVRSNDLTCHNSCQVTTQSVVFQNGSQTIMLHTPQNETIHLELQNLTILSSTYNVMRIASEESVELTAPSRTTLDIIEGIDSRSVLLSPISMSLTGNIMISLPMNLTGSNISFLGFTDTFSLNNAGKSYELLASSPWPQLSADGSSYWEVLYGGPVKASVPLNATKTTISPPITSYNDSSTLPWVSAVLALSIVSIFAPKRKRKGLVMT